MRHFFVGTQSLDQTYSAAQFESDALSLIESDGEACHLLCGGSMMYLDAVCRGIDDMPQADPAIRARLKA